MKRNSIRIGALAALFLCLVATVVFAAQDLFTLKSPNGIAFSEVRRLRDLGSVAQARRTTGSRLFWRIR